MHINFENKNNITVSLSVQAHVIAMVILILNFRPTLKMHFILKSLSLIAFKGNCKEISLWSFYDSDF